MSSHEEIKAGIREKSKQRGAAVEKMWVEIDEMKVKMGKDVEKLRNKFSLKKM